MYTSCMGIGNFFIITPSYKFTMGMRFIFGNVFCLIEAFT